MQFVNKNYSRSKLFFLILVICIIISIVYFICAYSEISNEYYMAHTPLDTINYNNHSECYKSYAFNNGYGVNQEYLLEDILDEGIVQKTNGKNIFFHQTDCIHDGIIKLRLRQACAVESAARLNPESQVFLSFAAQVGFINETTMPIVDALLSYENIHINNLNVSRYVKNSPCEELWKSSRLLTGKYVETHVSDLLRLLSLHKFGGLYLDLDTMIIQNITILGNNFAGAGDVDLVNNGIINLSPDGIGHEIATACLESFARAYNPKNHGSNGPPIITDNLKRICNTNLTNNMTREKCNGFMVYPNEEFYAYDYQLWDLAFKEETFLEFTQVVAGSRIIHFSNYLSADTHLKCDANVGYTRYASRFCPRVFAECDDEF